MAFSSNQYEWIAGVKYLRCRNCQRLKPATPQYFPHNHQCKSEFRPRINCLECEGMIRQRNVIKRKRYWNRPGYVYFTQLIVGSTHYPAGAIKIGFSSDINSRTKTLGYFYHSVICLGVIAAKFKDEKTYHKMFNHLSLGHEVFSPGLDLLSFIGREATPVDINFTIPEWRLSILLSTLFVNFEG